MTQHKSGANFSWSLRVMPKWFRSTLKPVTANSVGVAPRAQNVMQKSTQKFSTEPWLDTVSVFSPPYKLYPFS